VFRTEVVEKIKTHILWSCINPTFCLKLLTEKRRKYNLETYLLFIIIKKHLIVYKDGFYLTF